MESDSLPKDEQLAVLSYLDNWLPLVVITDAGNDSYHGLYCCRHVPLEQMERFADEAISLFADYRTLEPNALCRLPLGIRRKLKNRELPDSERRRQRVIYFNPEAVTETYWRDNYAITTGCEITP